MIRPKSLAPGRRPRPRTERDAAATMSNENVVVAAGPGAGKTELLAQRADFLLRTGHSPYPHRILAVSSRPTPSATCEIESAVAPARSSRLGSTASPSTPSPSASSTTSTLWVPKTVLPHAACVYSWMSPPSRSCCRTRTLLGGSGQFLPFGGRCARLRCGRWMLYRST